MNADRDEYRMDWHMPPNTYTKPEVESLCDRALAWGIAYGVGLSLEFVFVARFLFGVH